MKVEKRLEMGRKELDRVGVISVVCEGRRSQREAARELELSVRQVKRLVQRYRGQGAKGLISGHRIPEAVREKALRLVRQWYADFGPTLAHEYLTREHGLVFSVETLRHWMIEAGRSSRVFMVCLIRCSKGEDLLFSGRWPMIGLSEQ